MHRRFDGRSALLALMFATLGAAAPAQTPPANPTAVATPLATVVPVPARDVAAGAPIALHVGGRVVTDGADGQPGYRRQWPGSYFEGRFRGPAVNLAVGPGAVSLRIAVDGTTPVALIRPAVGTYRITAPGGGSGEHRIRIDVVSESQAGPTTIVGLTAPADTTALAPPPPRARQIEFIGDSHTVGYGNTATTGDCSQDQVWATTDTRQGPAGVTAAHYDADYQVNAISGRGVVRNYDGFAAPTLPQAYPFALLDGRTVDATQGWHPQVVVISLGTNDFSTALKPGERWPTRDALHADYEQTYLALVNRVRSRHPHAFIMLWATDLAGGEIAREEERVVAALHKAGDTRTAFVPVSGLRFGGCHGHPDLADDRKIAATLTGVIDRQPDVWSAQ